MLAKGSWARMQALFSDGRSLEAQGFTVVKIQVN